MSVTVSSDFISWCDTKQPCLDITINPSTEDAFGRKLTLIKERSEDHWYREKHLDTCDSLVRISIRLPEKEWISVNLEQYVRPDTCDYVVKSDRNSRQISCSPKKALEVLDAVTTASQEFFNSKSEWYEKAKTFIENGPQAEVIVEQLNPELEKQIQEKFACQPGALNLLADVKQKPYSKKIEQLLNNLLDGEYGSFTGNIVTSPLVLHLEECGFEDLVEKAYNDNYEHPGPDTDKDIAALFAYADAQVIAVAEKAVDDEQPVPDKDQQIKAKVTVVDAQVDDVEVQQDVSIKAKSSNCLNVFQNAVRIGQVFCNLLLRIGGN